MSYGLNTTDDSGNQIPPCDLRNVKVFIPYPSLPWSGEEEWEENFYDRRFTRPKFIGGSDSESDEFDDEEPDEIPVQYVRNRHWCFLGEIVSIHHDRSLLVVSDQQQNSNLNVSLDFDGKRFDKDSIKVGRVAAILYAEKDLLPQGENGVLVKNPKHMKIIPCDMKTLFRVNNVIEEDTPSDDYVRCQACGQKEEQNTISFIQCHRCKNISYCSQSCRDHHWASSHKRECKIFIALGWLKTLDWERYSDGLTFNKPHTTWEEEREKRYVFDPAWREAAGPTDVKPIDASFNIVSGEMLWGDLPCIVMGMKSTEHDNPAKQVRLDSDGEGTIVQMGWKYRVAAKSGVWKVAQVFGKSEEFGRERTGWIVYHEDESPQALVEKGVEVDFVSKDPSISYVNRYDWGNHMYDWGYTTRTWGDIDPDSGWAAALERHRRRDRVHKYQMKEGHPDYERWERPGYYRHRKIFLFDAAHGPSVVKFTARPNVLDGALGRGVKVSSDHPSYTLYAEETPVGCNLHIPCGHDYEYGRLFFAESRSPRFPEDRELVAFWYDTDIYMDGEYEPECVPLASSSIGLENHDENSEFKGRI